MSICASAVRINDRQFAVKIPQTGFYRVGEDDDSCVFSLNRDETAIVELELLNSIYFQIKGIQLTHYEYNGVEMTIDEYKAKVKELYNDAGVEDEDGNFMFFTVEQRLAWNNFNSSVKPVRLSSTTYQPVEITKLSQSIPQVGIPHVTPMHKISGDLFDTQYRLNKNGVVLDFVRTRLIKAGYTEVKETPFLDPKTFYFKNYNLEFSKFTNPTTDASEYLTISFPGLKKYEKTTSSIGTFEEVCRIKKDIEDDLRLNFSAKLDSITKMSDNPLLLSEVISMLEDVIRKVYEIDPKVGSVMRRRTALETLQTIISKLQNEAKKD